MMAHLTAIQVTFDGGRPPGVRGHDGHYYAYLSDPAENLIELIRHPDRY